MLVTTIGFLKRTCYSNSSNKGRWGLDATVASLSAGISPGHPFMGTGTISPMDNPLFSGGAWAKLKVVYPAGGFEVHYSLNDLTCNYADVKAKDARDNIQFVF